MYFLLLLELDIVNRMKPLVLHVSMIKKISFSGRNLSESAGLPKLSEKTTAHATNGRVAWYHSYFLFPACLLA